MKIKYIAVSPDVQTEMKRLRNSGLSLSVSPLYTKTSVSLKIYYLNARSLHKHIDDIRKDLNYSNTDISIQIMIACIPLMDIVCLEMIASLITLQDHLEVQLSTAESNSFLALLTVLIAMVSSWLLWNACIYLISPLLVYIDHQKCQ